MQANDASFAVSRHLDHDLDDIPDLHGP